MYCNNCGQEVPNNSGFCPSCGAKINPQNQTAQDAQSTEPRTIKLRCKNCNATMEVDASKQEAVCPYCGAKEKILDSDAVAVEKNQEQHLQGTGICAHGEGGKAER